MTLKYLKETKQVTIRNNMASEMSAVLYLSLFSYVNGGKIVLMRAWNDKN